MTRDQPERFLHTWAVAVQEPSSQIGSTMTFSCTSAHRPRATHNVTAIRINDLLGRRESVIIAIR